MIAILVFAAAMGWVEAMVVVYIRRIFGIEHVIELDREVFEQIRSNIDFLRLEQSREVATLVMLSSVAWLMGTSTRSRIGALLIVWGAWDIFYYISLLAIIRWPPSLLTSDILFLIPPTPLWIRPVIIPVAASCVMIAIGLLLFSRTTLRAGRHRVIQPPSHRPLTSS